MSVVLRIARRDGPDGPPRWESHPVDVTPGDSLHAVLSRLAEEVDPTLGVPENCGSAMCGGCGVRVQGAEALACLTHVSAVAVDGRVTVEPLRNHPVRADLVVDPAAHFGRLDRAGVELLGGGDVLPNDAMVDAQRASRCIHCGLCDSACPSLAERPDFLGPAALGWLAAMAVDPRNPDPGATRARAHAADGLPGCTDCGACDAVCPVGTLPFTLLRGLR